MHSCPECGQACCCQGDLDDCLLDTDETDAQCEHDCGPELDDDLGMFDFDELNLPTDMGGDQ